MKYNSNYLFSVKLKCMVVLKILLNKILLENFFFDFKQFQKILTNSGILELFGITI